MIDNSPYVVLVVSPSSGVGKSTLAKNLPVYLKGLKEDLPVAYISSDADATDAMFAFPGRVSKELYALQRGTPLTEILSLGEFGVDYCYASITSGPLQTAELRKALADTSYPGVLLFDLPLDHSLLPVVIGIVDLLLVPVKDPSVLGNVVSIRKQLLAAGGVAEQLWLLPSELGGAGTYQAAAQSPDFLRFSAEERDFQILDQTFFNDAQVSRYAAGVGKPVLTRTPQSPLHFQLQRLAEFVLQQRTSDESSLRRIERCRQSRTSPERAGRVKLLCPLCGDAVLRGNAHYLESIPARRRMLLHPTCLAELLKTASCADFLSTAAVMLLMPGAFQGGRAEQLKLLMLDSDLDLLESEFISTTENSTWQKLLRSSTGRCLEELYQDFLLISPAVPVDQALTSIWYKSFVHLRGCLRAACREEKIV